MTAKPDNGVTEAQTLQFYREQKRALADWELTALYVELDPTIRQSHVEPSVRSAWKRGKAVKAPNPVPGQLLTDGTRRKVAAYGLPEFVPSGITHSKQIDLDYEIKLKAFTGLLGDCIQDFIDTRIRRFGVKYNDKLLTGASFGFTFNGTQRLAQEIMNHLRENEKTGLKTVIEGLHTIAHIVEELQTDEISAAKKELEQ